MLPISTLPEAGLLGVVLLLIALFGLVTTTAVGILLIRKNPVPPWLGLAPMAMIFGAAILYGPLAEITLHDGLANGAPDVKASLMAMGLVENITAHLLPGFLVPLPALLFGLLCGIAGIRSTQRSFIAPAGMLLLMTLVLLVTTVGAFLSGGQPDLLVKLPLYLLSGLLAAASVVGKEEAASHLAGVGGVVSFGLLVGAMEVSSLAGGYLVNFESIAALSPAMKSQALENTMYMFAAQRSAAWVCICLTVAAGLFTAIRVQGSVLNATSAKITLALLLLVPCALWTDAYSLLKVLGGSLR